ncbi:IS110 family transposase [Actinomycetospora chiangmaiensis]|uniref:IS110 family transposase n=1 Tax=Actinomycetospora chiangmaiensis TaxID=402650 RepID=UPI00035D19B2|nr:IS110 family transposase [Actinomycetospora chiangmaiensis]
MLAEQVEVVIGVDTHKHTHTAAVVTAATGAVLAQLTVATDLEGYQQLLELAGQHSPLRAWAMEGSGGYGAGLAAHLAEREELVVELDRPARPTRKAGAKSDPIDAARAARDALARVHLGQPRTGPERAALQVLLTARRAAVAASVDGQSQLQAMIVTAPEQVRARFWGLSTRAMLAAALKLRPAYYAAEVHVHTAMTTLKAIARRVQTLDDEAAGHEKAIKKIVSAWRPDLLALTGVGPIVAATVLAAWSHTGRCRDDAAFAMLAGTAPIPASSGMTTRHRLNRSGDRQLNRAIYTIVITRLRLDPATRAYAERRRAQGKTDREIRRCLSRYVTRQLYRQLESTPTQPLDAS